MAKNNQSTANTYSVSAKASKINDATTGEIVVKRNGYSKVIPAVVFTPRQAERLLDKMEAARISAVRD